MWHVNVWHFPGHNTYLQSSARLFNSNSFGKKKLCSTVDSSKDKGVWDKFFNARTRQSQLHIEQKKKFSTAEIQCIKAEWKLMKGDGGT